MSTNLSQLTKQIRALPYADMMLVAEEIVVRLNSAKDDKLNAQMVATALAGIAIEPLSQSEVTKQEDVILGKIFSRKRTISITRRTNGWEISVPTLPASSVVGTELRPMFPMMLDQIITMHVLSHGNSSSSRRLE